MPSRNCAEAGFSRCEGASWTGSCGAISGARIETSTISASKIVAAAMIGVEVRNPKRGRSGDVIGMDDWGRLSTDIFVVILSL